MGFRTVVIKNRSKLDYSLSYLVCRGEVEKKIHLSEISMLIVESTAVSLTACLLVELNKRKIKVIFCDEKHLPSFHIMGIDDNYHTFKQLTKQIEWNELTKNLVWQSIIKEKINNQSKLLNKLGAKNSAKILSEYMQNVEPGDISNREGHAAKVYFNEMFAGSGRRTPTFYNSALNYGYAILLSTFCREITASGCITQLGIWHKNEFNPYNLASDFMEPYRPIVDNIVSQLTDEEVNFKQKMANLLNCKVNIANKKVYLENAVEIYVKSLVVALNENKIECIKHFSDYEL